MNQSRENTVTTKSTPTHSGPTIGDMRLSRLSHPRGTVMAMVLVAAVFLLFGMFASAMEPAYAPAPNTVDGAVSLIGHWVMACTGITG